ncbi:MAG TPA: DUF4256 domain-containing protein [Longimicrobiales bacterium]|nr:DUF4256 domain-containing protein [Longimicrobiales bacterium]
MAAKTTKAEGAKAKGTKPKAVKPEATKKAPGREQAEELLEILRTRFEENAQRHRGLRWSEVRARLESDPGKLWSLHRMEETGGEPDVIGRDDERGEYLFCDCSPESPAGRRSLCYDREALEARKQNKPAGSAVEAAADMGAVLLDEDQYRALQELGEFDAKTSSWLLTPSEVRRRGGAIFGDYRYGRVFIYHNGADAYYAARGFRCLLRV